MYDGCAQDLMELLQPAAVYGRGVLSHTYLEKGLLRLSEGTAARWLQERSDRANEMNRADEMKTLLHAYVANFATSYEPGKFIRELPALRELDAGLRARLFSAVRAEYATRFRPEERLEKVRALADAFRGAFDQWREAVSSGGPGPGSASLWALLRERATELHRLLADPDLRRRWIP